MKREWTVTEVLRLPVTVDVVTAGSVLGMGRTTTYEQVRTGAFPVPLLRLGARYRVPRAGLLNALGIADQVSASAA